MTLEDHADFILKSSGSALKHYTMPGTRKAILDSVQAVMDAGYTAGWAAFGELMLEQMPRNEADHARRIMEEGP